MTPEPTPRRAYSGQKVVVTGVAGFIGSQLADSLLARGATVVGIDRRSPGHDPTAAENLTKYLGQPAFRLVVADLADASLAPHLDGARVVFHMAAEAGVRQSWGGAFSGYLRSNVLGTQRLLEACTQAGIGRLVMASSSSVYGAGLMRPSREGDPTAPISPYGVTKLAAEHLCLAYARRHAGMSVIMLRYFTVFGPRQRSDLAIARILRSALTGAPFQLFGDGTQRRDFTYVDDSVLATLAAGQAGIAESAVVNVSGGRSASMLEVLDLARRITGRRIDVAPDTRQPGDVDSTDADLTNAARLLGYRPATSLADGITRQWKWTVTMAGRGSAAAVPSALDWSRR